MRLRVGERQRTRMGGDIADDAFADAKSGLVHGLLFEPFGGEKFEDFARPHDVGRAHLGHHVGGDNLDDAIEPLLSAAAGRHHVADPLQQAAGTDRSRAGLHQSATLALMLASASRAMSVSSACAMSSSMISWVDCSRVTKPTLWPAINEPVSMSPSMTARRNAPAQKCSIASCASFWLRSPRSNFAMTSRWASRNRSVALLPSARTGITGKRGSSCTDGTASRAAARINARLKLGWAIDSLAQTNRVPS